VQTSRLVSALTPMSSGDRKREGSSDSAATTSLRREPASRRARQLLRRKTKHPHREARHPAGLTHLTTRDVGIQPTSPSSTSWARPLAASRLQGPDP
jgi:hypothetical protein